MVHYKIAGFAELDKFDIRSEYTISFAGIRKLVPKP
jgi:hypothetical protein